MDSKPSRIKFLKVPLDIVSPEELPAVISGLLPKWKSTKPFDKSQNIILLSVWDLLKARSNKEYRQYVLDADLVLPISKSLVTGVNFLLKKKVYRYMPFNFAVTLLGILEKNEFPVFLLGSRSSILKKAEKNLRTTFPRLKIVGRYEGYMRKQEEGAVIEAVRKSSPSLLLAGIGIRGRELWIGRNSERLNTGLRLWCSDLFDVFAKKKYRPSDAIFEKGLESIGYCIRSPLKFFRVFCYLRFKILVLFYRLFRS